MKRLGARAAWTRHVAGDGDPISPTAPTQQASTLRRPRASRAPCPAVPDAAPDRQDISILVVAKPRQTHADKWLKRATVLRYRAFADELRLRCKHIPIRYTLVIHLPMPPSWSETKKRAMEGKPHQQRPDALNLGKAVEDALLAEDSMLWDGRVVKLWGRTPHLTILRTAGAVPG